ncbi:g7313 [Coccomyxa elongata]
MASEQKLGEISKALKDSIQRVDALQQRKSLPLAVRLRQHLAKNSGNVTNVLLAGCIFAVAAGRLNQQSQHQADKDMWEQEKERLTSEKTRLEEELNACKKASESLEADVRAELERKGWNRKSLPDRILIVLQRRKAGSYSTGNTATNAAILTASVPNEVGEGTGKTMI